MPNLAPEVFAPLPIRFKADKPNAKIVHSKE
jgi:hypothetical protein